jgi:hypothetical protein
MKKTGVVAKTIKKREKSRPGRQKCKKKTGFFAHFTTLFLAPQCLKSTFFYRGERGTSCLYWGLFLTLDSTRKDLNR